MQHGYVIENWSYAQVYAGSDASWICGIPNFSSSLIKSFDIDYESSFDSFANSTLNTSSSSNQANPGTPLHSSSPKQPTTKIKANKNNLRVFIVNCQSVMSKIESFWETIDSTSPDIICANETWLSQKVQNSEFIPDFEVYRKDRATGYGGVKTAHNMFCLPTTIQ